MRSRTIARPTTAPAARAAGTTRRRATARTRKRGLVVAIAALALASAMVTAPTVASAQDDGVSEAVSIVSVDFTAGEGCVDFPELCTTNADGELVPLQGGQWELNLVVPAGCQEPLPVLIDNPGSAWNTTDTNETSHSITNYCYAFAGVNDSSSGLCKFPCQTWDMNAAIRWLRANADGWVRPDDHTVNASRPAGEVFEYHLDPNRIAVTGFSSGGWQAAFEGTTNDATFVRDINGREPYVVDLEGTLGPWEGIYSSDVQAVVPRHAPTDFSKMNPPYSGVGPPSALDHDGLLILCPECSLVGCPIGTSRDDLNPLWDYDPECDAKVQSANPIHYVTHDDPPQMIFHGSSDSLVPHGQSVYLYEALRDACRDVRFYSMDGQNHADLYLSIPPESAPHAYFESTNCGGEGVGHGPPDVHVCALPAPPQPQAPEVCEHDPALWRGIAAWLDRVLRETTPPDLQVDASGNPPTADEVLADGSITVTVQTDEASWYDVVALAADGSEVGTASVELYDWGADYPRDAPAPYATTIEVPITEPDAVTPGAQVTVQVTARDRVANEITLSDTLALQ